jgi:hypothetical protein
MTTYNEQVIKDIEETVNQYMKIYKKLPASVRVSHYEYQEYRKALQNGVKPKVVFKGKEVAVNVIEDGGCGAAYDFEYKGYRGKGVRRESVAKS